MDYIRKQIKQTNLKKYGNYTGFNYEKIFNDKRYNYWNKYNTLLKEKFIEPLFDKEYYCNNTTFKFKCLKCNNEFEITEYKNPQNIYCSCNGSSNVELQLFEWVKSLNEKIEGGKWFSFNNKRYELDIFLPEYNLGIEMDGLYWHSTLKKENNYHINKTNWFKENFDINVIHVLDLEWSNEENRLEIENIIKSKLNLEKLNKNKYINCTTYDKRYFPEIKGKILESKTLEFGKLKYQDCGYIKI